MFLHQSQVTIKHFYTKQQSYRYIPRSSLEINKQKILLFWGWNYKSAWSCGWQKHFTSYCMQSQSISLYGYLQLKLINSGLQAHITAHFSVSKLKN